MTVRSSSRRSPATEYGAGSVYYEPSRDRWIAAVILNGVRRRQRFHTEAEAIAWRRHSVGRAVGYLAAAQPDTRGVTLSDWLRIWVQDCMDLVTAGRMSASTAEGYDAQCRLNIVPFLGHLRLTSISSENIRHWIREDLPQITYTRGASGQQRKLSPGTQKAAAVALRAALRSAVQHPEISGLLTSPMAGIPLPGAQGSRSGGLVPGSNRSKAIHRADRRKLRDRIISDGCDHIRGRCAARFRIGLECGLRQGEVLGLLITDLDDSSHSITVQHHLDRSTWRQGCAELDDGWSCGQSRGKECPLKREGGGMVLLPGTKAGSMVTREIVLPADLWQCVQDHIQILRAEYPLREPPQGPLLFRSSRGNSCTPEADRQAFHDLCRAAHIPQYTVHSLRHTCATHLIDSGQDISVVSAVLGHASIIITQ